MHDDNTLSLQLCLSALDTAHAGLAIIDNQQRIIFWNQWLVNHSGISADHTEGKSIQALFPEAKLSRIDFSIKSAIRQGMSSVISQSINQSPLPLYKNPKNANHKTLLKQSIVIKSIKLENSAHYALLQVTDVSAGVKRELTLRQQGEKLGKLADEFQKSQEFSEVTLDSITEAVLTTDAQERVNYVNSAACHLLGLEKTQLLGQPLFHSLTLTDSLKQKSAYKKFQDTLQKGFTGALTNDASININGKEIDIDTKIAPLRAKGERIIGSVTIIEDVSHERYMRDQLSYQASHDELTGLINRREFKYRLEDLLHHAKTEKNTSILLYMDLDQFKVVNDTCGHYAGDALLKQLSHTLTAKLRTTDTLARLGGDEFSILLSGCSMEFGKSIANTLRETVEAFRFRWEERNFSIGVSIGLVLIDENSQDIDSLLGAADSACFLAKERGRNQVVCYEPEHHEVQKQHGEMLWASRIQDALEQNQFTLYCQPIMPTSWTANNPIACEILIRMIDDAGNLVPPMAFIPAAERYNQMTKIDRWVVENIVNSWQQNPDLFEHLEKLAINLSGQSFNDPEFLEFLILAIEKSQCPWEKLCFEITETAAVSNIQKANRFMVKLKLKGARFSLDDFGSGLSSFAYLKNLPVDYLKIDGVFIKDIMTDTMDDLMVKSIAGIGRSLGLQTVAEFVENADILKRLKQHGIDYAQGYFISKPIPFTELSSFYQQLSNPADIKH